MRDATMNRWSHQTEIVLPGRGTIYRMASEPEPLTYGQALELLASDAAFRSFLTSLLSASPYAAFRWETPSVSISSLGRPFEFVLLDDHYLDARAEPAAFGSHFSRASPSAAVLSIDNLGRTAQLVVPRPLADPKVYAHIAAFVRGAPSMQIHALWQAVSETALRAMSDAPLWISTAGHGVSWLHVRIEHVPKYYAYRPYANDIGL
jgi:hypothetical protein